MDQHQWHSLASTDILKNLTVDADTGLSSDEARKRLEQYGPNELAEGKGVSSWELLFQQFKNVLVIILIIAVGLSAFLGHEIESIAIGVIVLFAVILGFVQEYRAEKAMEALRKMSAPTATVVRDGEECEIPAREVVPGDIVVLSTGDRVPADARLIESMSMQTDEAALTGESLPVEKHAGIIPGEAAVGDQKNIVFSGTVATYGRGRAVVVATGMQTEFGKIAGMLQAVETEDTPLQRNLDKLGKTLAKTALGIVLVISVIGYMRGQPLLEIIIFGIALAVAVVPEALPAVVTISLAIGVQRMIKRHVLIRRLPVVETLGSTTVICTDKTGTLTKDEMTVRKIYTAGVMFDVSGSGYEPKGEFSVEGKIVTPTPSLIELLRGGALAGDAKLIKEEHGHDIKGDPTEGGIIVAAAKAGLLKHELDAYMPRTAEIPFTSETKRMTTLHRDGQSVMAYAKGAPEVIVQSCTRLWGEDGEQPLTEEGRKKILDQARTMASQALRVIAIARKGDVGIEESEKDMKFLGLVGMIDPPRPEAKDAIQKCRMAGIRVVMITGDHPVTAEAIARELGLLTTQTVVTGAELEAMDQETLTREVDNIGVYARVSPAHKLRVIAALQKKGEVVAMTGDGVNDAPALKKADIGVAMGITGTDVTKEAAAMTLTNDNFASIVAAVEEGRGIFGNIKKYIMYMLTGNLGEVALIMVTTIAALPVPLSPVQILYINLATGGLPALALALDPPEADLMSRPPRGLRSGIFSRPVIFLMLIGGLWSMVVNLAVFLWALDSGRSLTQAMGMTFVSLILIHFFKAYNFRSDRHSIFTKPFANKWLNYAIMWELLLLLAIIYVPFLHAPFDTFALSGNEWIVIGLAAFTVMPILEIAKFVIRRAYRRSAYVLSL
jgi:Ca2+-transporting ATPase